MHAEGRIVCLILCNVEISIGVLCHFFIHDCFELVCILLRIFRDFFFVFLLLGIVDREFAHEKVAWILPLARFAETKVLSDLERWALVCNETIGEQDKAIAIGEGL